MAEYGVLPLKEFCERFGITLQPWQQKVAEAVLDNEPPCSVIAAPRRKPALLGDLAAEWGTHPPT